MKRITAVALLTILNGCAGIVRASAQENGVRATIPFDSSVSNLLLPLGTYVLKVDAPNVISIFNCEKHTTVLSLSMAREKPKGGEGKLIFNRYRGQHFLSRIHKEGGGELLGYPRLQDRERGSLAGMRLCHTAITFFALK
jgi:hypothetical protein